MTRRTRRRIESLSRSLRTLSRSTEFWLVIGTWALAVVGGIGILDSRRAVESSERAWLAPLGGQLKGAPAKGQPLDYVVFYRNVGKDPALKFTEAHTSGHIAMPDMLHGQLPAIPENDTCVGLHPTFEKVVYPSSQNLNEGYELYLQIRPDAVDGIIERMTLEYVQGCFAYESMGSPHHSSYCFFLDPQGWAFKSCPTGSDAD